MIADTDRPETAADTQPAPPPYQDEVDAIQKRSGADLVAIVAFQDGNATVTLAETRAVELAQVAALFHHVASGIEKSLAMQKAAEDATAPASPSRPPSTPASPE